MQSVDWRVLALSCLSCVYGNGQAGGILNLEPQTEHEYMEGESKIPHQLQYLNINIVSPLSLQIFTFSTILIYLLTLQSMSTVLLARSYWFNIKSKF